MKLDRLLGILTILSQKGKVKAKDLADRFEVSLRTIYRDVDAICLAGIPLVTYPGGGGGISIADGFSIDQSLLTQDELGSIILGLKSLDSVLGDPMLPLLLGKISGNSDPYIHLKDDIIIDLASHYKSSLAPKIRLLREALSQRRMVQFHYYAKDGSTQRVFEPYCIVFKWTAWYVFGYCRLRSDFRLFKLNRITQLLLTEDQFDPREVPEDKLDFDAFYSDPEVRQYASLLLDRSLEYVMIDEFGPDSYEISDNGTITAQWDYINEREMVKTILSLGSGVRVVSSPGLVMAVQNESEKIAQLYK
jgi:predicted DNA-binding transcriptional regulator YafY